MRELYVRSLSAWSPLLNDISGRQLEGRVFVNSGDVYLPVLLKPGESRRLSQLTIMGVDIALQVSDGSKVDHAIFATRHGEIVNSEQLLSFVGRHEILSPTAFSQSVHNTAIGTYALIKKIRSATTALSSGAGSFLSGLVSAYAYLNENPLHQVLLVVADEQLPKVFAANYSEFNSPYAMAMLLGLNAGGIRIALEPIVGAAAPTNKNAQPQALQFLKWLCSNESELLLGGVNSTWLIKH